MTSGGLMRIGELSRRSGIPVKALRAYTDRGLVYSAGRSPAGYRLFDESALWCTGVITSLRDLGLTVAEIGELADTYLGQPGEPIGPHLARLLRRSCQRTQTRIRHLQDQWQRIEEVLGSQGSTPDGLSLWGADPRRGPALDSAPGGRP